MVAIGLSPWSAWAESVGTAFMYQGQLKESGVPVSETCNFAFRLFDAEATPPGAQIGPTLTFDGVGVNPLPIAIVSGLFEVALDFGSNAFSGEARWLEIDVCCPTGCSPALTPLVPRQELTPAPYALFALNGGGDGHSLDAADGVPVDALFVDNAGNVGIGTTSPSDKLHVVGNIHASGTIASGNSITIDGTAGSEHIASSDALEFHTGGVRAMRLEPAGPNVLNEVSSNVIGGYSANSVTAGVVGATISGGGFDDLDAGHRPNSVTDDFGTVAGGSGNDATNLNSTVAGGVVNTASGQNSTVGGGSSNTASNTYTTVGGGQNNAATGLTSTIPGGRQNTAGGSYSFAAGRRAKVRTSAQVGGGDIDGDEGTFVWADSTNANLTSTGPNQFLVRASGGMWFGTTSTPSTPTGIFINTSTGAQLTSAGVWKNASDAARKQNFTPVDTQEILQKVARLPVTTWNYRAERTAVRHLGPTAQDFAAAFGLGEGDKTIGTIDADGVSLAAIQGLYELVQEKHCEIVELRRENVELAARMAAVERALTAHRGAP